MIYEDITQTIGRTPVVRVNRLAPAHVEIYVKLEAANPAGSVTFWVTDGKLVKYEFHVSGTISFNGNDRDIDRTTTVVISDVGTTKISVPDEAKKKLE